MINVRNSNTAADFICNTGFSAGAGALASYLVSSPIGAAGGAAFGFVEEAARIPLRWVSRNVFNSDHPLASQSAKTMAAVLDFFGRFATAWGVLHLAGMTMTFAQVAPLVLGIYISVLPVAAALVFLGIIPNGLDERQFL